MDKIIETIIQSVVIEKYVEGKVEKKVKEELQNAIKNPDWDTKNEFKKLIIELLDERDVSDRIKKIMK